ncbi:MAG: carbohydrate kinase family protein [Chloroflexi bacterium]|nr:carbohydrate kinase family protein [Chloroflexota bacterium]
MAAGDLVVVAGVCNVEVTCPVAFPMEYESTRFATGEIEVRPSGVAYNVALALVHLGTPVRLATFLGRDLLAEVIRREIEANIGILHVSPCDDSPRSIVLYANDGRRSVITDLRELASSHGPEHLNADAALDGAGLLAAGNINANRKLVAMALERGIPIATDLQSVRSADDEHNADFLLAAAIVFISNVNFINRERELLNACRARNARATIVVGLGGKGALLDEPGSGGPVHLPAHASGGVVNTGGAGDALFAAFLDGVLRRMPAVGALERAVVFAGAKVSARSSSEGHLEPAALDKETARYRAQLELLTKSGPAPTGDSDPDARVSGAQSRIPRNEVAG